jgi:hypothetical protein
MPIDPFSFKGAAGNLFSEMDRLNKLLSAANPALKLQSAISKMTQFRGAIAGVDLSPLRGALADHARFAGVHSEHLRLAIQGNEHFKAITAAAGGGAFSASGLMFGSRLDAAGLSDLYPGILKRHALMEDSMRAIRGTAYHDAALRSAELASRFRLPGVLDAHRIGTDMFADRLAAAGLTGSVFPDQWKDTGFLSAFGGAAAMASAMSSASMMNGDIQGMMRSLASAGIPSDFSLPAYRGLLDAAGLILRRWPAMRRLSPKERAERQAKRLRRYRQPPHIGQAKSLVHQYERYLREVIDELMTDRYGDDWADVRLPVCAENPAWRGDARKLLSVWKRDGGNVLDHADYVHYRMIMIQEDHFADIFAFGFGEDPEVVADLIDKVRKLRAASHHAREDFTPQDLQDLHVTWKAIALGLEALTVGMEMVLGEEHEPEPDPGRLTFPA